eukprot:3937913-Rhodomonas_salina.1
MGGSSVEDWVLVLPRTLFVAPGVASCPPLVSSPTHSALHHEVSAQPPSLRVVSMRPATARRYIDPPARVSGFCVPLARDCHPVLFSLRSACRHEKTVKELDNVACSALES